MMQRYSPPTLLPPPADLVAVVVESREVLLAWSECGAGGLGFRIERATCNSPCRPFVEIGGVGPHITAFRDKSVKSSSAYSYRVHARYASGDSPPSNVVVVTMPQAGTDPPSE
jgi:hypothetical protein